VAENGPEADCSLYISKQSIAAIHSKNKECIQKTNAD
jgi:hypothetical protein